MVVQASSIEEGRRGLSDQDLEGDLIQRDHPLYGLIWINPQRMGGTPCIAGSRVPVKTLFEYIEGGDTLDTFLDHFPPIRREQVVAVLEAARRGLLPGLETE